LEFNYTNYAFFQIPLTLVFIPSPLDEATKQLSKDGLSMMKTVLVELEQINQQFTILTVLTAGVGIQQFALICNK
jgi:hypothetical protein